MQADPPTRFIQEELHPIKRRNPKDSNVFPFLLSEFWALVWFEVVFGHLLSCLSQFQVPSSSSTVYISVYHPHSISVWFSGHLFGFLSLRSFCHALLNLWNVEVRSPKSVSSMLGPTPPVPDTIIMGFKPVTSLLVLVQTFMYLFGFKHVVAWTLS